MPSQSAVILFGIYIVIININIIIIIFFLLLLLSIISITTPLLLLPLLLLLLLFIVVVVVVIVDVTCIPINLLQGELIGGSQREERLEQLEAKMVEFNLSPEDYWWYNDLRRCEE